LPRTITAEMVIEEKISEDKKDVHILVIKNDTND